MHVALPAGPSRLVLWAMLTGVLAVPAAAQHRDSVFLDSARALAPLTVTATRDAQAWLLVPLALTRITDRDLFGRTGFGLDDALNLVPGVVVQSRYGGSDVRIAIRGFGARGAGDRSNAGTSRGIRLLLDGVPETEPDGRTAFDNVDLAAITSMEVIRSNASALWGNAAGGVVSLSTLDAVNPRLGSVETQFGSSGLRRAIVRGGGAMGRGAIAASLVNTEVDGWRQHSGASRWTGALSVRTDPLARTRLGVYAIATDNLFRIPGPLTLAQVDSASSQANATYLVRDERRHNRLGRLSLTLDHDLGGGASLGGMLFGGPKYLQRSERGTFRDFTRYHVGGNAVFRSRHALGVHAQGTLLAGVDEAYQDGAILFYSLDSTGNRGTTLRDNKREGANNLGVFAQEQIDVGERVSLTLGARYDAIGYYYDSFIDPTLDAKKTFGRVSPKLGVTWRVTPTRSLYASVGGGVEAPAGNETDPASTFGQDTITAINPLLEPILSTTFEIGTKHLLPLGTGFVRSVVYDVALYTTGVTNDIVPYRGGRFYFTAGRTRRSGIEVGLKLDTRSGLMLQSAVSWSRNRYTAYVVDSVHYGVPGASADYSGHRVVGVPDLVYDVGLRYALSAGMPLSVRLGVHGMSSFYADDANTVNVPGYGIVNATVGFDRPLGITRTIGLRGFVTVNNLLDKAYVGSAFLNPDVVAGVPVAFEPGLPRNLVVSFALVRR
jgi:iron complex outermembrane receptor protein